MPANGELYPLLMSLDSPGVISLATHQSDSSNSGLGQEYLAPHGLGKEATWPRTRVPGPSRVGEGGHTSGSLRSLSRHLVAPRVKQGKSC